MTTNSRPFYGFGPFRVDQSERLLLRGEDVVPLTPKAFEMLLVLLESSGRVLTKEELMKRVWPDSFVEEANLSHNIYKLREALGQGSNGEKYIETVPRRGYRFVAKVTEVQDGGTDLLVEEHSRAHIVIEEDDTPPNGSETKIAPAERRVALPAHVGRRSSANQPLLIAGCIAVIGLILGLIYFLPRRGAHLVSGAPLRSIAVLPFKPLVSSERNESLEIGMAETLITRLSSLNQIIVRPTSSVRKYTDLQQDSIGAGRELKVDSVLDGNIQKSGDQLRVTARLVRVSDGSTIWADKFDTKVADLFSVQDSISEKVVSALALTLTGEQKKGLSKRYTDNVAAYQLYLQGRYHWSTFRPADMVSSLNYYRAALDKDPKYALAYAGIAVSYSTIGIYGPLSAREAGAKSLEAARKAVELDDELAEAHVSLGVVKLLYDWDWEGARGELERGIQLDPNTTGHTPYGYYLAMMGKWNESLAELERTSDMSPGWQPASNDVLWTLYASRRYAEAIDRCEQAIKLDPNNGGAHWVLGQLQTQKGMYKEATATLQQALKLDGADLRISADLGYVYALSGETDRAMAIISQMKGSPASLSYYLIAEVYTGLGNKDQAFAWLDKAYEERFPFLCDVRVTPQFDSLRSDPRYVTLVRRMNLSP
jgi:DNA-binding winged helix-turn-helix (wHTH) protein/TolB-like protein/tetratricopeptide (TPR) repeat protein